MLGIVNTYEKLKSNQWRMVLKRVVDIAQETYYSIYFF